MLKLTNVEVIYDQVILVLKGVSLDIAEGRIVALLGANGAGKSTTLKAISGLLRPERGEVTEGTIEFRGERLDRLAASQIVRLGIVQVMEGRRVFEHLTTAENLLTGAHTRMDSSSLAGDIDLRLQLLPPLSRTPKAESWLPLGRRTADASHRSRLDGPSQVDPIG
jgi:branched-chain amino acid transport system ATP-binding protein